jgi:hypothetical protein
MLGLTDSQLTTVMDMARVLPVEKRSIYLKRIAAMLMMRGRGHFNDADVGDVAKFALTGLAQGGGSSAINRAPCCASPDRG